MNIGETYRHRYSPQFTCTVTGITHKGAKVAQTEKRPGRKDKTITAYYDTPDFNHPDKRLWEVTTPALSLDIEIKKVFTPAHRPERQAENQIAINF